MHRAKFFPCPLAPWLLNEASRSGLLVTSDEGQRLLATQLEKGLAKLGAFIETPRNLHLAQENTLSAVWMLERALREECKDNWTTPLPHPQELGYYGRYAQAHGREAITEVHLHDNTPAMQ